jgi:hypothetical protein
VGRLEASGVDELTNRVDTRFSMVSRLSTNIISHVGWYVDNGASRHMTRNRSAFSRLEEQDISKQVELSDDGKYPMTRKGSISFHMPVGEVLELHEVFYVPHMTKTLLLVSCVIDLRCSAKFDDQEVIIKSHSPDPSRVLAQGRTEGGLYKLLANIMKRGSLLISSDNLCELWHKRFSPLKLLSLWFTN